MLLLSLTVHAVASHLCAEVRLLSKPACLFTTCCNLTDVVNSKTTNAHMTPCAPHIPQHLTGMGCNA